MLLASVRNSSQIDRACKWRESEAGVPIQLRPLTNIPRIVDDRLVSTIFFIILFFVILGILGVDISALFLFLSGLIVSFAFMIGSACSKYLEVRMRCVNNCLSRFWVSNALSTSGTVVYFGSKAVRYW